jgi:hypothetical protein
MHTVSSGLCKTRMYHSITGTCQKIWLVAIGQGSYKRSEITQLSINDQDRFLTGRMRKDNKDAGSLDLEKRVSRQRCGEGVGDSVVEPKLFFSAPAPVFIKFWLQLWLRSRFWLQLEPVSITFLLKIDFCMKCQFYYYLGGQRKHLCRISFFFCYATEGQQCFNIFLQYDSVLQSRNYLFQVPL